MNAAARMIHQTTLFNGELADLEMSKSMMLIITLLIVILMTGLAVTYTTNAHRLTYSHMQQVESQHNNLELQWSQLLLEQASLATPARVEQLAINKLGMYIPNNKNMYVLKAQ